VHPDLRRGRLAFSHPCGSPVTNAGVARSAPAAGFLLAKRLAEMLLECFKPMTPARHRCIMALRKRRWLLCIAGGLSLVVACADAAAARRASLLPTQQRIRAPGKEVTLGLFPMGMALSADGRLALVTNNGFLFQKLTVVDTQTLRTMEGDISPLGSNVLFLGVALSPDGRTGYASGHTDAGDDVIHTAAIAPGPSITVGTPIPMPQGSFPAGMAISADGHFLYVAENVADKLAIVDTAARTVVAEIAVGRLPWGVALHPVLPQLYVSNRGDGSVSVVDTDTREVIATVVAGNNPNAVAVSPDGSKIFVANAGSDDLTVFDVNRTDEPRRISLRPFEDARPGSSPNALAFSPDGERLYVANAWDNALAVVWPQTETVLGLIPTGWYPTAIAVSPDNRTLYFTNMKGGRTFPRTRTRQPLDFSVNARFGGSYGVRGTLQIVPVPRDRVLPFLERQVRANNGFDTKVRPSNAPPADGPCFPIPCGPDDRSPIKHVVFIVRENKTYDQLLGDLPQADGEARFVLFGESITPNLHKLVQEFLIMDRFFANSEKSEPGHQWTTASIDADYVEKTWPPATDERRPDDIGVHAEGGVVLPVAQPAGLYWFDNCFENGVTFRNYGEFMRADATGTPIDYWVQNTDRQYRPFDLDYSDQLRFEEWKREFDEQVRTDTFPQFTYIALPNDHTKGTTAGAPDPRSFVADNDLATGKIVEAISNSRYWPETVIFLTEDDPQSGSDHIDSHRTVGTVIGPYVRRHHVAHTRYDMASMHRTMELILGLPPMSQFDQLAIPMRDIFTDEPDLTPYTAVPASFPLQMTAANPGAELSASLDWTRPDRVPDAILNKLLWDYLRAERQTR
jgi:YVTN family beta-propeller protein